MILSLIAVSVDVPHLSLQGVVAKPEVAHEAKARQFFAVNGHPVHDKMIARSLKDAFGTLLPPTLYPSYALNLAIHPGVVDVNIHPRKDEVRFVNPQEVYRFVLHAVSQSLDGVNVAFETLTFSPSPPAVQPSFAPSAAPVSSSPPTWKTPSFPARRATFDHVPFRTMVEANEAVAQSSSPILVLDNCYLVTIHDGKLLLVDQHAAHERILYNQLWEQDQSRSITRQPLLISAELTLAPDEAALFAQHKKAFEELGFGFVEQTITEVPSLLRLKDPVAYFHTLLRGLNEERLEPELTDFKHKLFATMACKAAIKAGDVVSPTEQRQVMVDLLAMPERFTCPHGRPSHIEIAPSELEKLFKRTGF